MVYKAVRSVGVIAIALSACSTTNRTQDHSSAIHSVVLTANLAADAANLFEQPFRLKIKIGVFVDTGDDAGFAGPTLADIDGDGLQDLVVGQFSGLFRVYRNVGTEKKPVYAKHYFLKAGGELAGVPMG